jgi:hypothetical protein
MADLDARANDRRVCAKCKQPVVACVNVTQHLLNGVLPIGRSYIHRCGSCQASFETESTFRTVYELWMGTLAFVLGGVGVAFIVAWAIDFANGTTGMPSLYQAAVGAVTVLIFAMGVYLPIRSGIRVVALLRNPVAR